MSENRSIRILSAGAPKSGVRLCAEAFFGKTGQPFAVEFATAPVIKERVKTGAANADVLVLPVPAMQGVAGDGFVVADSVSVIGSVTTGVVVRNGAFDPDLTSVETFVAAMLDADRLVYNHASSGQYIADMIDRLGIADQVAARTVLVATGAAIMEFLVEDKGDKTIGFCQITEIKLLEHLGVHLVGPLPEAIGKVTTYAVGLCASAGNSREATSLIEFMAAPEGKRIFVDSGVV
ncbi:MAG: ABC transporter substrate-binding protein [Alphaproteobacteria bacterium]|nr:MAG: ABC transporter substrate-binding protein [Alphaproteobacteria bacterium]